MLTCVNPTLDRPVILFQDVIKILHRSMSTLLFQNSAGFELNDGWRISSVLVGVDDPRRGMVLPAQGFGQKALGRRCIAFGREKEVDRPRLRSLVKTIQPTLGYGRARNSNLLFLPDLHSLNLFKGQLVP